MDTFFFHPKLVHLPIALAVLMPLISGGLLLAWWRDWLPRRAFLMAVGLQALLVGSGLLALRSGEADEERVEHRVGEAAIERHEAAASTFMGGAGAVLALMLLAAALGQRRAAAPLAALATAGTLLVLGLGWRTGEAGGALVYPEGGSGGMAAEAPGGDPGASPADEHGQPGERGEGAEADDDD